MKALDVSNWTGSLSVDRVNAWKQDGIGLVVVQAVDPPPPFPPGCTQQQITVCAAAGLEVHAYLWLWFDLDAANIRAKLELIAGLPVTRLWLDVEDTAGAQKYDQPTTEAKIAAALATCDAYLPSQKTGIYTGRWFWAAEKYAGNTAAFADRDLWDAHYDGQPDPAADFVPYGGWTAAVMKQWAGTSTVDGVGNVDQDATVVWVSPAPSELRETPADYPWSDWRRSAIAYRGALDAMGQQLAECQKEKPV